MNLKKLIVFIIFFISLSSFAQDIKTLETTAIIKKIERKGTRRPKDIATVEFVTKKGDSIQAHLELFRIPILGNFNSVDETITVIYEQENPAIVKTKTGDFITKYGMYILIFLGVIISIKRFIPKKN